MIFLIRIEEGLGIRDQRLGIRKPADEEQGKKRLGMRD
jgi:hypothetical protein